MHEKVRPQLFLVGLVALALMGEAVAILHESGLMRFHFLDSKAKHPGIAQVASLAGDVRRRNADGIAWTALEKDETLHAGDLLATSESSTLTLHAKGSSQAAIEILPDSLLKLEGGFLEAKMTILALDLEAGSVRLLSHGRNWRARFHGHELFLPTGSELTIVSSPLTHSVDLTIQKGEVELTMPGDSKPVSLRTGEAFRLEPSRGLARLETKLRIEPLSPRPGERLTTKASAKGVGFTWNGDEGEWLEWDVKDDFSSLSRSKLQSRSARVPLLPGHYYWRIRRDLATSAAYDFLLLPELELRPQGMEDFYPTGDPITLAWNKVEGAVKYVVEIADSPTFSPLISRVEVSDNQADPGDLRAGHYLWRVTATHKDWGELPASEPFLLTVGKPPKQKRKK